MRAHNNCTDFYFLSGNRGLDVGCNSDLTLLYASTACSAALNLYWRNKGRPVYMTVMNNEAMKFWSGGVSVDAVLNIEGWF